MKKLIFFIPAILLLLVLCISQTPKTSENETQLAIQKCISLCKQKLAENVSLANGPCLSNEIIPDWVCDVAHWPRQPIDDLPENQCPAFGKTAHNFVEVNETCGFIRVGSI
ncbi:hypothetical protein DRN63_02250 [Nanoarchaeota archaeon]|nr:MAG: hypothetical protein DRN63_02250 [Nanoarchaeota archaeon]